jgi:hypothetical protein
MPSSSNDILVAIIDAGEFNKVTAVCEASTEQMTTNTVTGFVPGRLPCGSRQSPRRIVIEAVEMEPAFEAIGRESERVAGVARGSGGFAPVAQAARSR